MSHIKPDWWQLMKYIVWYLASLVIFFAVAYFTQGMHFIKYDEHPLKLGIIFMILGLLLMILGSYWIENHYAESEKRFGLIYLNVACGLLATLWGYFKLFQATGLDNLHSLILLADGLTILFVIAIYKIAPKQPSEKRNMMWMGAGLSIVFGLLTGIDYFVLGMRELPVWLKAQLITILLFSFAIQSQGRAGNKTMNQKNQQKIAQQVKPRKKNK